MALSKKIVSLIDEGYEVSFRGDDICRGLKIRVQKSVFKCEAFIGYDEIARSIVGSEFIIMERLNQMVRSIDSNMKGETA